MARYIQKNSKESFRTMKNLIDRLGFIERNGRRYSVVALAALALALKGDPERICHRVSRGYRHNSRELNRQNI